MSFFFSKQQKPVCMLPALTQVIFGFIFLLSLLVFLPIFGLPKDANLKKLEEQEDEAGEDDSTILIVTWFVFAILAGKFHLILWFVHWFIHRISVVIYFSIRLAYHIRYVFTIQKYERNRKKFYPHKWSLRHRWWYRIIPESDQLSFRMA